MSHRSRHQLAATTLYSVGHLRCFNSVHQWVDDEEVLQTAVLPSRPPVESVPATAAPESEAIAPLAAEPAVPEAVPPSDAAVPVVEELRAPPAAALPEASAAEPLSEEGEQQLVVVYGARRYRVRSWPKQLGEALKVNVLVSGVEGANAEALHVDTLDLYQAKQRAAFARSAAAELSVEESILQHDLGRLLLKLEQLIEERAKAAEAATAAPAAMSEEQKAAALALLRDPQLTERIIEDVERIGLVGEPANALTAYLACVSRKLAAPLAVLIQSTSAAGCAITIGGCCECIWRSWTHSSRRWRISMRKWEKPWRRSSTAPAY
jgi:DNA primase